MLHCVPLNLAQGMVMGHRLSKIYTRTGDQGTTGLSDGTRVSKASLRVESYGTVDELNSIVGLLLTKPLPADLVDTFTQIQHDLFDLGGELSFPSRVAMQDVYVDWLEQQLDRMNETLPPLKEFILPGGSESAAVCHLARTVCRRAERLAVALANEESINPVATKYLNRLSDLLFVAARYINKSLDEPDVLWQPGRRQP